MKLIRGTLGPACRFVFVAALFLLTPRRGFSASVAAPSTTDSDAARAVLERHCVTCHGATMQSSLDLRTREGWLRGGTRGPAIVPRHPERSLLMAVVSRTSQPHMPPKGKPLTSAEIGLLRKWIQQGALENGTRSAARPARVISLWSLRPMSRPQIPEMASRSPIDALLESKLEARGLTPAPLADRGTLIRRAFFDLIGLPPSPEQMARWTDEKSPDWYKRMIDELLASPQYGERWGRHWLDVARYADSGGYETDIYYRNAWRYRDYVVKSFNDDKPYHQFVQEQIAADELWPDDITLDGSYNISPDKLKHLEARLGTGLYALGPQIHESNMDGRRITYERLTDWVDTTASVFMGLTLGCARCHDHKFDPFTQRDYYRLQAVFASSKEVEVPVAHAMAIASYRQHYPRILAIDEARRAYRRFEQRVQGRGGKLTPEEEQERRQLLERIAQSVLALPESIPDAPGGPWDGLMEVPSATVLGHERPELVPGVHRLHRGELTAPREKVEPGLPEILAAATASATDLPGPFGSRKQLALWLTRPDHPLTSRVMANRIWQWHFGRGLVATPNDFGKMGQAPSHPELLDWLASELVRQGGSIKAMHRLIMQSEAYKRSSRFANEANVRIDPENIYLWRMNRRRLEGEALWDAMHATAGTLNLKLGGRPAIPPLAEDEIAALRDRWQWAVSADPGEHQRRGLYLLARRNFRFPMFESFDAPVNSVSCPCRDVTTVAPQALWFLNNQTAWRAAQAFAARIAKEAGSDQSARLERAWRLALGRSPSDTELIEARQLFQSLGGEPDGWSRLCLSLFNLNEFAFVD